MPERTENHEDSHEQPETQPARSMRLFSASSPKGVALPSILKRYQRTKHYGGTPVTSQRVIAKSNQEKFRNFGIKVKQKSSQNLRNLEMPTSKKKASWDKMEMTLPNGEQGSAPKDHSDLDSLRQLLNAMPSSSASQPKADAARGGAKPAPLQTTPASKPTAQPKVSKPGWKKPDPGVRRYSRVEEVSPVRAEPGQMPETQPQAGRVPTPPAAAQDRPVIQRQMEKTPAPEVKPQVETTKPALQKPVESIQRQTSSKPETSEKPEAVRPQQVLPDDLPLKRPVPPKSKQEPRTVEIRRQPQQRTPAEVSSPKIEDSGRSLKDEKSPVTAVPDKKVLPISRPETPAVKKEEPSSTQEKQSSMPTVKPQPVSRMSVLRRQKRQAEAAVQRMLDKSPDESRPFTRPFEKPQMTLASKTQSIKSKEIPLKQKETGVSEVRDELKADQKVSRSSRKTAVQMPIRLNLWKKTSPKEKAESSNLAAAPLTRIQKPQKPQLQQKLARRSFVQRTLATRKTSSQPLVLRKPAGTVQVESRTDRPLSDEKKASPSDAQISRPVVQRVSSEPVRKPASDIASKVTSEKTPEMPARMTSEKVSRKPLIQKPTVRQPQKSKTLIQRTFLKPERKPAPPVQRSAFEKQQMLPQVPEMPVRKAAQAVSRREQPEKTQSSFAVPRPPVILSASRKTHSSKTIVQRLVDHQRRKITSSPQALLLKPQTKADKAQLSPISTQAPIRQQKAVPDRPVTIVQRVLETSPQKPLRLTLKQKPDRKEAAPFSVPAAGVGILAARKQTKNMVQRIQAKSGTPAQKQSVKNELPQVNTEKVLRQKIKQAFPDKSELPVVNVSRQSSSESNLIQRAIADGPSVNEGPGADNDMDLSQAEPPQENQQAAFNPPEDVSWNIDSEENAGRAKSPDLQSLARQVFPIVKRLLALEKERSTGRSF